MMYMGLLTVCRGEPVFSAAFCTVYFSFVAMSILLA